MNASKARDFFSAYYEGELNTGLREAFERTLTTDAELKRDYDEFCSTMEMLAEPAEDVALPSDLHDKIMAKLDHQAWEAKQTESVSFWGRWRLAMVGGLAMVAIVAGVVSLSNQPAGKQTFEANPIGISVPTEIVENVDATFVDGAITLKLTAKAGSEYSVLRLANNSKLADLRVGNSDLTQVMVNENAEAQAFAVISDAGDEKLVIVVPGTEQGNDLVGEGTVLELAMSMADAFRTPIIVRANDRTRNVQWKFDSEDGVTERAKFLESQGLNLSLREDRISLLSSF